MKKKIVVLLIIIAVLFIVAGCGDNAAVLNSVDAEMHHASRVVDNVTVELLYPVVSTSEKDADKLIETLNQNFQDNAAAFVELVAVNYAESEADEYFAYQADVVYNQRGMISVVEEQWFGQSYARLAATYSLSDGEKMTMGELMGMKEDKAEEYIIKMFSGIIQYDPASFHADAETYVIEHIKEVQYYYCNEGVAVFFPIGSIAPAEMGIQEMVVQ